MKKIKQKIYKKQAKIGVIGLGYVGLPLVTTFLDVGYTVYGFDVDKEKINLLRKGKSYIQHIDNKFLMKFVKNKQFRPTNKFSLLAEVDAILICVPTPLNEYREPDLSYVLDTAKTIADYLRKNQLVVLESTTYPGTTDEEVLPILEQNGLKVGKDFYLAFSPEREDPGNKDFVLRTVPKIVGGITKACLSVAQALYDQIVTKTVPVSSTKVAEAAKLLENIYRSVNIALVNELKVLFDRMGIDVFEIIEAAKTKPFGFHAFYPGPGLGGHCIPIDPFYLTWKARKYDFSTRFIELAGEINTSMPYHVVSKAIDALGRNGKAIGGAKILTLGVAYKKDIDDQRESPALKIIDLFSKKGAKVFYNDPFVKRCYGHRHYPDIDLQSVKLTKVLLKKMDCVVIVTDHTDYDYSFIAKHTPLLIDTRNATMNLRKKAGRIVKA